MRWGIDGDVVLYSVAFAAKDDPISYACNSVRSALQNIMDAVGAEGAEVYLTGGDNYRHQYAMPEYPYKGNRSGDKPEHFVELRKFMIDSLGAVVAEGEEADDLLGIDAVQRGHGIATIDKDLWGVPGWHYNFKRKELSEVSPEDADRFFYQQLLTGDSTDNIPGLYKMTGKKATQKVLNPIGEMTYVQEMYDYVHKVYTSALPCYADVHDLLLGIGRLLWIRRQEGELWTPPSQPQ